MPIRELAHEEWPAGLLEIPQPPKTLWLQGALPPPHYKKLAVVGSRAISSYGRDACQSLVSGLSGYPISIISGLAIGIDTAAHEAALSAGLHSIAVPGSGLHESVLYPRRNRAFAQELLAAGGALLSEYPPKEPARPYYFPERNRLMVGLADAVLVIEAGAQSGTLITARLAGEYGRELLMVPHRIGDAHGFGAHLFLRLGATLVAEPLHILEAFGIPPKEIATKVAPTDLSPHETAVYAALADPLPRDELIRRVQIPAGDALTALVSLELRGLVEETFGAWRRT